MPKKETPADAGGFEVLDEEVQAEPVRPEAATQAEEEEVDDRPPVGKRSRREDDDDDDDDRPSGRSRRYADDDENEEDDRPRGRSRRDDDDEDEEDEDDDRPRSRSRDDDEDEDDDRARGRSRRDDEDDRSSARSRRDDDEDDEEDDDERPLARSRRDEDDDEDQEDEDDDRPRARSRQDDDDDEKEEDDEPRARSRQDEDDEDDGEDERPRARARQDEDDEEDEIDRSEADEDEDDEDAPPRMRSSRDEDDEEDDEDDLPVRYSGADDDDDEDEDSIPRRRPGDRDDVEQRSGKKGLILIGLLMLLLVGAGGGAAAYFLTQDDKKVAKNNGDKPPPDQPQVPDPKVPDPKVPDPKVPDPKLVDVPGLPIQPVNFPGDRKAIRLPGKVGDIRAGGDGRYLFLHCPDDKKLLVYDSSEASLVREIPTAGKDAAFGAGAGKLILADNTNRTLQRYDLMTLEKDKEGPFPFDGRIEELALGAGSNGPALVVTAPPGTWPVEFLDVETLGKADVGWKAAPAADLPRVTSFSAAANGSRWAGIPAGPNALGAVVVTREGKQISADLVASDKSLGYVALSADGQSLCSRLGTTNMSASVARVPAADGPSFVSPAVSGNLFVHVLPGKAKDGVSISLSTTGNVPSPKGPQVDVTQPYTPGDKMTPDRHLHLVPEAKALVICPSGPENKLDVIKFDPVAGIPPSTILVTSTPPDAFRPGGRYAYKVRTLASIPERNYELSGGPKGAVQQNGVIAWNVPADEKQESVRFRFTIRAPGRAAFDQIFTVYNTAAPAPKTEPPKRDPKVDTKSPEPKTPTVGTPSNIAPGVKLVQESSGRLPISAPEMKDPHVEVALPGPIRDACVAGGGRFLIFHCASVRKMAIFDVNTLKIEKLITLNSDDVLFAASMEKLLVIYPDEKVVIRYSLATFKLETDLNLEVRQRPNAAAMGSATAGPLILGGVPAQNNASNMVLTFLDLDTMKEVAIDKAEGDFKVKFGAAANLRVSADGRTLGAWYMNLRPSGLQIARLAGNTIGGSYVGDTVGHVTPGPDGQMVFTEKGMYTTKGEPTGKREATVPAVHGNWFVTLAPNAKGPEGAQRVSVWEAGKTVPLAERDDLPGFDGKRDPFERDNPTLALDRRLFLVPEAKILIVVPPAANKLHVYRVEAGKK